MTRSRFQRLCIVTFLTTFCLAKAVRILNRAARIILESPDPLPPALPYLLGGNVDRPPLKVAEDAAIYAVKISNKILKADKQELKISFNSSSGLVDDTNLGERDVSEGIDVPDDTDGSSTARTNEDPIIECSRQMTFALLNVGAVHEVSRSSLRRFSIPATCSSLFSRCRLLSTLHLLISRDR